jgi:hypothetical protein
VPSAAAPTAVAQRRLVALLARFVETPLPSSGRDVGQRRWRRVEPTHYNRGGLIDTRLADLLKHLPKLATDDNLAFRNLTRAKMMTLATGKQTATFLSKGVNVIALTAAEVRKRRRQGTRALSDDQRSASLTKNTPLWFYIVREAALNNGRLKGVGARIAAETVQRAMERSPTSIIRDGIGDRRSGRMTRSGCRSGAARIRRDEEPSRPAG